MTVQIVRPLTKSRRPRNLGPVFVDLLDETRLIEWTGKVQERGPNKGKMRCRVYFDETPALRKQRVKIDRETGEMIEGKPIAVTVKPPVFCGVTYLPAKMFDDGTANERTLTPSQRVGFLFKGE